MKILLLIAVVQALNLVVFAWFNRTASLRILVLRQQLAVYKRRSKKPLQKNRDRLFWSWLSGTWNQQIRNACFEEQPKFLLLGNFQVIER